MKAKIVQNIKSVILALILVLGVGYVSAVGTWSNPTATPPGNNADTPLNVAFGNQIKQGTLWIKGYTNATTTSTNGLIVENGRVGIKTTNPAAGLHLAGASGSNRGFFVEAVEGDRAAIYYNPNAGVVFDSYKPSDSRRLPVLLQPNGGNVGIGTLAPTQKLDVAGIIKTTGLQVTSGTNLNGKILVSDASGVATWQSPAVVATSTVMPGTLCGMQDTVGTKFNVFCNGLDIITSGCPSGYTKQQVLAASGNKLFSCVKN